MRNGGARPPFLSPSLRAQRSNPESLRGKILDCFVAGAPRNDAWREWRENGSTAHPWPAASSPRRADRGCGS
ncbi:hypothetical protein GPL17_20745 [Bradyrhizobium yuanmingense]|nr:hypothetical protein [Bradyrhizobium yuanmingense]